MASWKRAYLKTLIQITPFKYIKSIKITLYKSHPLCKNKQAQMASKEFRVAWPAGFSG